MDAGSQETPSDDYGFAFNQVRFSDSVLRIEIVPDPSGSRAEPDDSLADWIRNRKRRRDDDQITYTDDETVKRYKENNTANRSVSYENQDEGATETAEERPEDLENAPDNAFVFLAGRGTAQEPEASSSISAVQVKTIHISSPILAAKSPFFYKLLSNEERDSERQHVTLRIHASEEDALMDLLKFTYCNTLRSTTPTALLKVLMVADKFEVASCMRFCCRMLQNMPMFCESALFYLDLPSILRMPDTVRPLTDAAKKSLASRFKEISKCKEELLNLPLLGFEAVLSSDDLRVSSEDVLFGLVLKWAQKHYPVLQDRREILSTRLIRYIRFPYMSCLALKHALLQSDIERTSASEAVLDALFRKAQSPFNDRSLGPLDPLQQRRLPERAYLCRPAKVVEFESPLQQRIIYLDLRREECARLFPSGKILSETFDIGGQRFVLCGQCRPYMGTNGLRAFGLSLETSGKMKGCSSLTIDCEFASRAKPSLDFVAKFKAEQRFSTVETSKGCPNLFGVQWKSFMADESPYFIDGVLHLRADLKVTKRIDGFRCCY